MRKPRVQEQSPSQAHQHGPCAPVSSLIAIVVVVVVDTTNNNNGAVMAVGGIDAAYLAGVVVVKMEIF